MISLTILCIFLSGYTSYLGYILLEHQHANPVIQCFTRLLMESVRKELNNELNYAPQNGEDTLNLEREVSC